MREDRDGKSDILGLYLSHARQHRILSRREEEALAKRIQGGDEAANGSTSCKHDYPILVAATESGGKRARCLGCKKLGPEGEDAERARQRIGLPHTPVSARY